MESEVKKRQNSKPQARQESVSKRGIYSASASKGAARRGRKQLDEGSVVKRNRFRAPTLPELLEEAGEKFPLRTALIYFGGRISYGELLEHINRCAAGLQRLGFKKGERLALMMPNCPQFVIAYFGALRAGGIVTATNTKYTSREAAHQWRDAGATTLVVEQRCYDVAKAACMDTPALRAVIQTSLRDYYPKRLAALNRKLRTRVEFGVSSDAGREHLDTCPEGGKSRSAARSTAQKASKLQPRYNSSGLLLAGKSRAPMLTTGLAPRPSLLSWRELLFLGGKPTPVQLQPSDIACLQYTGGTTGTSKGAMLTHSNLVVNANQTRHWFARDGEREVLVAALPLFHIYAMTCVMVSALMAGASVVVIPRFELRAALNVIRKHHPTVFHGVPTMYVGFNNARRAGKYGFKSLRFCMSGGAPLPIEVQQKFEKHSGGRLVEGYGLTEASPVTHVNPPDGQIKAGSIGLPIPGTEAKIMDLETGTRELAAGEAGELIIRGPQVMKGYWNKPQETEAVLREGWLYTGDIARMDEDGYFYIVDRKKDMIIAGGYNIYPREIEEVLFEHSHIQEAVVIGVPDPYRGETVKAFVVLKSGDKVTEEELISWCRERIAAYKIPRRIQFCESLPKSSVGKYLKRELRKQSMDELAAVSRLSQRPHAA